MNLLAASVLILLALVVLLGSKRWALLALAAGVLYLSEYAAIKVLGLNLFAFRFLEIALLVRLVARRELALLKFNAIDRAFVLLNVYSVVVYVVRSNSGQALPLASLVDAFLVYFPCRVFMDSPEDFRWFLRAFVLLLIPYALLVLSESLTGGRSLAFTGWHPAQGFGGLDYDLRNGRIRCTGSFRHPSLLGTIGVGFIPMFIGMAFRRSDRKRAALGIALCLIIVWAANSGGPIGGLAFGCLAWCFWMIRTKMRAVRWGIVGLVLLLVIFMKAPIWYLPVHVSSVTGGGGWHRSYLMNMAVQDLGKWWLAGMPMADTADWFPYKVTGGDWADITNQFIFVGLTAGAGAVALFILLLKRAFSALGKALQAVRAASPQPDDAEFLLWGLGCMLAAHIVNWFGISYFDQTWAFWYLQLAAMASLSQWHLAMASKLVPEEHLEEAGSELGGRLQPMAQ
jgi:hypothetical protein